MSILQHAEFSQYFANPRATLFLNWHEWQTEILFEQPHHGQRSFDALPELVVNRLRDVVFSFDEGSQPPRMLIIATSDEEVEAASLSAWMRPIAWPVCLVSMDA